LGFEAITSVFDYRGSFRAALRPAVEAEEIATTEVARALPELGGGGPPVDGGGGGVVWS
jgi:hypothetical protein